MQTKYAYLPGHKKSTRGLAALGTKEGAPAGNRQKGGALQSR